MLANKIKLKTVQVHVEEYLKFTDAGLWKLVAFAAFRAGP